MPCNLPGDEAIPLGRYGTSNVGRAKTVYRMGLSYRYGRRMQTISGIHYNFSLAGVGGDGYFALIRNFRRLSWLPLYLFGASPAVCTSFVEGRAHELKELAPGTLYLPYATSLRMGRLGYQSDAQANLSVSYNSLASYSASLQEALTVPYPPYEKIGIRDKDSYRQLSTSLLQIENEFYSPIRPKRRIKLGRAAAARAARARRRIRRSAPDGPRPVQPGRHQRADHALPRHPAPLLPGRRSPPDNPRELAAIARNKLRAAQEAQARAQARAPRRAGRARRLGKEVVSACEPIAGRSTMRAAARPTSVAVSNESSGEPDAVPSARVLHAMARNHGNSHVRFTLAESLSHRGTLLGIPLKPEVEERFARLAENRSRSRRNRSLRPRRLRDLPALPQPGAAAG